MGNDNWRQVLEKITIKNDEPKHTLISNVILYLK